MIREPLRCQPDLQKKLVVMKWRRERKLILDRNRVRMIPTLRSAIFKLHPVQLTPASKLPEVLR